MSRRYLINSIPKLNEIFNGGIPEESLIHIYGPFKAGKTYLILQLIYELVGKGFGNALYIDTEASVKSNFLNSLPNAFRERFKYDIKVVDVGLNKYVTGKSRKKYNERDIRNVFITVLNELGIEYDSEALKDAIRIFLKKHDLTASEKLKSNAIYVLDRIGVREFLSILDIEADVQKVGEKTEVKIRRLGDVSLSPLSRFIRDYSIKFMVVDSIGMLVKNLAISLSDLPARATVTNLIIGGLIRLASEYKLIIFVANHESRNPVKQTYSFYGGSPIGYGFKYSLYLAISKDNRRVLIVDRAPHLAPHSLKIPLVIGDDGFKYSEDGKNEEGNN